MRRTPRGTVHVVDPNPLNWLYLTYNTVEELVRVIRKGKVRPAAMRTYRWSDDRTLEVTVRDGNDFHDGQPLTATSVQRAWTEQARWAAPHPPGTHFMNARFWRDIGFGYENEERRGPLVSDRRTGPVGHRTVRPRRGTLHRGHRTGGDRPRPVRRDVAAA